MFRVKSLAPATTNHSKAKSGTKTYETYKAISK